MSAEHRERRKEGTTQSFILTENEVSEIEKKKKSQEDVFTYNKYKKNILFFPPSEILLPLREGLLIKHLTHF